MYENLLKGTKTLYVREGKAGVKPSRLFRWKKCAKEAGSKSANFAAGPAGFNTSRNLM